jgi:prepilin-type N-terminal cleavage/methylation domain-containing protein
VTLGQLLIAPRTARRTPLAAGGRNHSAPAGFTLLELAIVIFIMALMFTIAIPYLGSYRTAQLKSTARQLAGRATFLFDEAETHKLVLRLVFDLDHQVCGVTRLDPYAPTPVFMPDHSPGTAPVAMPNTVRIRDVTVGDLGTFSAGVVAAQFYPEGYVDPTLIHLIDLSGHVMTLAFSPLTGQVLIAMGDRSMAQMMSQ